MAEAKGPKPLRHLKTIKMILKTTVKLRGATAVTLKPTEKGAGSGCIL